MAHENSVSFCPTRWKHATINFESLSVKSCCFLPFRDVNLNSDYDQFHDDKPEVEKRLEMLNEKRPGDCNYCWNLEDKGAISPRLAWSQDEWITIDDSSDLSGEAQNPSWVELIFSTECNLKCSYCGPNYSSGWRRELGTQEQFENNLSFDSSQKFKDLFWNWFQKVYQDIHLLKVTGGEPLLAQDLDDIFEFLLKNKNPKLSFGINSNLYIQGKNWESFVQKVKKLEDSKSVKEVVIFPSLESWGERAEYARYPLKLDRIQKNIDHLIKRTNVSINFGATINVFSITSMKAFWAYVLDLKKKHLGSRRIHISSLLLSSPEYLRISLLPEEFKSYVLETVELVQDELDRTFDIAELKPLYEAQKLIGSDSDNDFLKANFFKFIKASDKRRGNSFSETFPEMKAFYTECKKSFLKQMD